MGFRRRSRYVCLPCTSTGYEPNREQQIPVCKTSSRVIIQENDNYPGKYCRKYTKKGIIRRSALPAEEDPRPVVRNPHLRSLDTVRVYPLCTPAGRRPQAAGRPARWLRDAARPRMRRYGMALDLGGSRSLAGRDCAWCKIPCNNGMALECTVTLHDASLVRLLRVRARKSCRECHEIGTSIGTTRESASAAQM